MLSKNDLQSTWQELGLAAGDNLVIHSAIRTLGPVEGGAETVLDSLSETVGEEGCLVFPCFNYSRPRPEPWFDPLVTPGRTGILGELARKRPGAHRSLHPTHSVAALGRPAPEIVCGHLEAGAFGVGSPLDKLAMAYDGKILLLGVPQTANSTIHIAESHARRPKEDPGNPPGTVRLKLEKIVEHTLDWSATCSVAFGEVEHPLRSRAAIQDARQGDALLQLISGKTVVSTVTEMLRQNPFSLLCTNPACAACTRITRNLHAPDRPASDDSI